ncbi:hypothetical protein D6D25_01657 [Aureobasidium pullulans]|nr:hypothetical protein D6D25_01657 [Aureobasidium pullulans]
MDLSRLEAWPSLEDVFNLMVSICLEALIAINHAARAVGPSIWVGLNWIGHGLSVAGNALLAAVLILLLWISIIYLCCFTIFMFCKLVRRHQKQRHRGERAGACHPGPHQTLVAKDVEITITKHIETCSESKSAEDVKTCSEESSIEQLRLVAENTASADLERLSCILQARLCMHNIRQLSLGYMPRLAQQPSPTTTTMALFRREMFNRAQRDVLVRRRHTHRT